MLLPEKCDLGVPASRGPALHIHGVMVSSGAWLADRTLQRNHARGCCMQDPPEDRSYRRHFARFRRSLWTTSKSCTRAAASSLKSTANIELVCKSQET